MSSLISDFFFFTVTEEGKARWRDHRAFNGIELGVTFAASVLLIIHFTSASGFILTAMSEKNITIEKDTGHWGLAMFTLDSYLPAGFDGLAGSTDSCLWSSLEGQMCCDFLKGTLDGTAVQQFIEGRWGGLVGKGIHVSQGAGS